MSTDETQDEPVMAGADDATAEEKADGRREQDAADGAARSRAADDDGTDAADPAEAETDDALRSIRATGEDLRG